MELESTTADDPPSIAQALASSTILPSKSATDSAEKPWEAEERKREEQRKISFRNSVWKELLDARGPRYRNVTLANFIATTPEQQAAKAAVQDYATNIDERLKAGQNVLFIGPAGTGKDHLMFALCHPAIGAFKTLLWINGTTLWLTFRDSINEKRQRRYSNRLCTEYDTFDAGLHGPESQIIDKLAEVDVLAISDPLPPGSSLTDYQTGNLLEIIDRRYSHLLPTWMTINVANRKEAETRMGAPTVDRLAHDALTVVCDWPSFRAKKLDENGLQ